MSALFSCGVCLFERYIALRILLSYGILKECIINQKMIDVRKSLRCTPTSSHLFWESIFIVFPTHLFTQRVAERLLPIVLYWIARRKLYDPPSEGMQNVLDRKYISPPLWRKTSKENGKLSKHISLPNKLAIFARPLVEHCCRTLCDELGQVSSEKTRGWSWYSEPREERKPPFSLPATRWRWRDENTVSSFLCLKRSPSQVNLHLNLITLTVLMRNVPKFN